AGGGTGERPGRLPPRREAERGPEAERVEGGRRVRVPRRGDEPRADEGRGRVGRVPDLPQRDEPDGGEGPGDRAERRRDRACAPAPAGRDGVDREVEQRAIRTLPG